MRNAEHAGRALIDRDGPARMFERVLETGLVVTYARPYLDSNRTGGVGGRWKPPGGLDRDFHRYVIDELRDTYHAHATRTDRRTLTDTTALLGLEGSPTFAETWSLLGPDELEHLATLAAAQAERFEVEARKLDRELGEIGDDGRQLSS
jgi:hypothetical protein